MTYEEALDNAYMAGWRLASSRAWSALPLCWTGWATPRNS